MYAIRENLVTCAEPDGCGQPGTEEVIYEGVVLEFCERHAVKRWLQQKAEDDT